MIIPNNHQFAVLEPNCQKSAHVLRLILTGRQKCNCCHRGFQDQWSDTSKPENYVIVLIDRVQLCIEILLQMQDFCLLANSKRGLIGFFLIGCADRP